MRCKTCHYSLEGLPEHRCPECGREFDPHDPNTLASESPIRWRPIVLFAILMVLLYLLFLAPSVHR